MQEDIIHLPHFQSSLVQPYLELLPAKSSWELTIHHVDYKQLHNSRFILLCNVSNSLTVKILEATFNNMLIDFWWSQHSKSIRIPYTEGIIQTASYFSKELEPLTNQRYAKMVIDTLWWPELNLISFIYKDLNSMVDILVVVLVRVL